MNTPPVVTRLVAGALWGLTVLALLPAAAYGQGGQIDPQVLEVLRTHYPDRRALTAYELAGQPEPLPPYSALRYDDDLDFAQRSYAAEAALALGIEFLWIDDSLLAVPYRGGAAFAAGLTGTARVEAVNGFPIRKPEGLRRILAGIAGDRATVTLRVAALPDGRTRDMQVLPVPSHARDVETLRLDAQTLVIRIFGFNAHTMPDQVATALRARPWAHVVLDLRYSAGGSVAGMSRVAGLFLGPDRLLADLDTPLPGWGNTLVSRDEGPVSQASLTVLIGPWTYSASELLAQALAGWQRAVLVGQASRGKCLLQRAFPAGPGLRVLVPVAEARFGSRHCHKAGEAGGVIPDIELPDEVIDRDDWIWRHVPRLARNLPFVCSVADHASSDQYARLAREVFLDLFEKNDPRLLGSAVHAFRLLPEDDPNELCFGPFVDEAEAAQIAQMLGEATLYRFAPTRLALGEWRPGKGAAHDSILP